MAAQPAPGRPDVYPSVAAAGEDPVERVRGSVRRRQVPRGPSRRPSCGRPRQLPPRWARPRLVSLRLLRRRWRPPGVSVRGRRDHPQLFGPASDHEVVGGANAVTRSAGVSKPSVCRSNAGHSSRRTSAISCTARPSSPSSQAASTSAASTSSTSWRDGACWGGATSGSGTRLWLGGGAGWLGGDEGVEPASGDREGHRRWFEPAEQETRRRSLRGRGRRSRRGCWRSCRVPDSPAPRPTRRFRRCAEVARRTPWRRGWRRPTRPRCRAPSDARCDGPSRCRCRPACSAWA